MHVTKSTLKRSAVLSSFGGAAAQLAAASAAWGCVGYPAINPVVNAPSQVVPGSQVEITGAHWAETPVRIRWANPTAVVLTEALTSADGRFATSVTVPGDAQPGFVTLYAQQGDSEWKATTRTEVVPASTTAETVPPVTTAGTSTGRPSGGPSTAVAPKPIVAPGSGAAPATGTAQPVAQAGIAAGVAPDAVSPLPAVGPTPQLAVMPPPAAAQPEQAGAEATSASDDKDGKTRPSGDAVKLPSSAAASPLPRRAAVSVGGLISIFAGFGLVKMRRRRAAA